MATPGQASVFTVESEGKTYTLRLDINALCLLEDSASANEGSRITTQAFFERIEGDMRALRLVVWAALQRHHKDATLDVAGDVATAVIQSGNIAEFIAAAIACMTPDAVDVKALALEQAAAKNPLTARSRKGGTGPRSTGPRAATG